MHGKYEAPKSGKGGGAAILIIALAVLVVAGLGFAAWKLLGAGDRRVSVTEPSTEFTTAPTTEATTESATEATTESTTEPEPVYTNPLNGEIIDGPFTKRIFSVSINNLQDSLPHVGTNSADIYMEMFVNYSIIRGLALYTDPTDVPAIGSVRSTRVIFSQISRLFDTVMIHAGGNGSVLANAKERGVESYNIDTWDANNIYSFRDKDRSRQGYGWEHTLFARGDGIVEEAVNRGIRVDQDPDKDYGLCFTEDGTPENGEAATSVSLTFSFNGSKKDTTMVYDEALGKYVYNQYGKSMVDGATGEPEAFKNVVILLADMEFVIHGYHQADFVAGGEGYFACGGKLIPIRWKADSEEGPLRFTTLDGEPLLLNVGNSYIAIAAVGSPVTWDTGSSEAT